MWCVLREARNYILREPGASSPAHQQQGRGGKARRCAARSELLPGSRGQVSGPVSRLAVSPQWGMRCFGSFMHPGPRVGPAGPAWAPNPASIMWALQGELFPKGAPVSHVCGSPPEEPLSVLSGKLQPACLAFECSPRLCLFSLLFKTSFVPFWLG